MEIWEASYYIFNI